MKKTGVSIELCENAVKWGFNVVRRQGKLLQKSRIDEPCHEIHSYVFEVRIYLYTKVFWTVRYKKILTSALDKTDSSSVTLGARTGKWLWNLNW